jgi:hypothetical protein
VSKWEIYDYVKPDAVLLVGGIMIILMLYILWLAHKSPTNRINVADLLVDSSLKPPRATLAKFVGLGAWMLSSWILVYITVTGGFNETAFTTYLFTWGAVKVAADFAGSREGGRRVRRDWERGERPHSWERNEGHEEGEGK